MLLLIYFYFSLLNSYFSSRFSASSLFCCFYKNVINMLIVNSTYVVYVQFRKFYEMLKNSFMEMYIINPPPPYHSKVPVLGSSYFFYNVEKRGDPGESFEHLRRLLVHIIRLVLFIALQVVAGKYIFGSHVNFPS